MSSSSDCTHVASARRPADESHAANHRRVWASRGSCTLQAAVAVWATIASVAIFPVEVNGFSSGLTGLIRGRQGDARNAWREDLRQQTLAPVPRCRKCTLLSAANLDPEPITRTEGLEDNDPEDVASMLAARRDLGGLPGHLAIIMDGNRRFAKARNKPASFGHLQGKHRLVQVISWVMVDLGIRYLSVYALSVDNLQKRSRTELAYLAELMATGLEELAQHPTLVQQRIQVKVAGCIEDLPARLQQAAVRVEESSAQTAGATPGGVLTVCIGYSGRSEILHACKALASDIANGRLAEEEVTEEELEQRLFTAGSPPPDLVVRTSGEARVSNFMLWQMAYAELVFVEETWPEFDARVLLGALEQFADRARRFGG